MDVLVFGTMSDTRLEGLLNYIFPREACKFILTTSVEGPLEDHWLTGSWAHSCGLHQWGLSHTTSGLHNSPSGQRRSHKRRA